MAQLYHKSPRESQISLAQISVMRYIIEQAWAASALGIGPDSPVPALTVCCQVTDGHSP